MMVMMAVMVVEVEVVIAVAILTKMANLAKDRQRVDENLNETSRVAPCISLTKGVMLMIAMMVEEVRRLWLLWRR